MYSVFLGYTTITDHFINPTYPHPVEVEFGDFISCMYRSKDVIKIRFYSPQIMFAPFEFIKITYSDNTTETIPSLISDMVLTVADEKFELTIEGLPTISTNLPTNSVWKDNQGYLRIT
jgi:hypothetical protein